MHKLVTHPSNIPDCDSIKSLKMSMQCALLTQKAHKGIIICKYLLMGLWYS